MATVGSGVDVGGRSVAVGKGVDVGGRSVAVGRGVDVGGRSVLVGLGAGAVGGSAGGAAKVAGADVGCSGLLVARRSITSESSSVGSGVNVDGAAGGAAIVAATASNSGKATTAVESSARAAGNKSISRPRANPTTSMPSNAAARTSNLPIRRTLARLKRTARIG